MMREKQCYKCGSLSGSSHVNRETCLASMRLQMAQASRIYHAWLSRVQAAQEAWDKEEQYLQSRREEVKP